jgi:hypothetical protein
VISRQYNGADVRSRVVMMTAPVAAKIENRQE